MGFEIKTYSRKQAGVIYSAMKRGDIEVAPYVISEMYDMVGRVEIYTTNESEYVQEFAAGVKLAIDYIFENDYERATKTLQKFAA